MKMYQEILTVVGSVGGGAIAGAIVARHRMTRLPNQHYVEVAPARSDGVDDTWIDQAATEWATKSGRPEAKSLIANKLRLGLRLQQRSGERRWTR